MTLKSSSGFRSRSAAVWSVTAVAILALMAGWPSLPSSAQGADGDGGAVDPNVQAARTARLGHLWDQYQASAATKNIPILENRTGIVIAPPATFPSAAMGRRVTIHFTGNVADAFAELTRQTGVEFVAAPQTPLRHGVWPNVTIDATDQPLMESVLEICSQAGIQIIPQDWYASQREPSTQPAIYLQRGYTGERLGDWCVCGAFAFMVRSIENRSNLTGDLHADSNLDVALLVIPEPGATISILPDALTLDEATDELGHALSAVPPQPARPGLRFRAPEVPTDLISTQLQALLPDGAGKRMTRLRAHYHLVLAPSKEHVVIDPFGIGSTVDKTIAGMVFTFGPFTASDHGPVTDYSLQITVKKGALNDGAWAALAPSLETLSPSVIDAGGTSIGNFSPQPRLQPVKPTVGDSVALRFNSMAMVQAGSGLNAAARLVVDLPMGAQTVDVPVEFNNLPLP